MKRVAVTAAHCPAFLRPMIQRPHLLSRLKWLTWAALFWTALSLFFASQIHLLEPQITWRTAFAFSAPRWYVWGLLVPGIYRLDRKLNSRPLAERVALHLPLGVAWTLLAITIRLLTRPLRGSPWPHSVSAFFLERFYWDLLIYAVIAGISIARDYARQLKERDAAAHAMELRTADLERRLVEAQLQSLRAQLHPHFLFNTLKYDQRIYRDGSPGRAASDGTAWASSASVTQACHDAGNHTWRRIDVS